MAAPRAGLNPTTQSVGFTAKVVTVQSISADGTTAVTVDRQNTQTAVPMMIQRSKGPLPQVGETWCLTQDLGMWTFAAIVATSAGVFAGGSGGSSAAGSHVTVAATAPVSPQTGDIWVNGSAGDALYWWSGNAWVAAQFGTQALADQAVTAAKIALATITSEQIAPDAGITAGQVAFTVGEIGGNKVWSGTSQPQNPAIGDLWINPADGNMVSTWNGNQWVAIQFGAQAIQPGSLTSGQLSEFAGIEAAQVSFTAAGIGGITTSVSGTSPVSPNLDDLWFNAAADYALYQWNGTAWTPYQFGTSAIAAGSVTAALIAANTITAAQIAAGTITAEQIAAGTITAQNLAVGGIVNANPYFAGGDLTGWTGYGGALTPVPTPGTLYPWGAQLTPSGFASVPSIEGTPATSFPVVPGQYYLVSAIVRTPATAVQLGFSWENSARGFLTAPSVATISVPAGSWDIVSTIQQAPAGASFAVPYIGLLGTPSSATTLQAQAVVVLTPINGGVIEAGTITAAQIAAGTVVAGIINGTVVTGSTIQNSTGYPKTSINPDGSISITNSAGAVIFKIAPDGTMYWYNAAGTQLQMELQPGGTTLIYASATGPQDYDFEGTGSGSTQGFTAQNSSIVPSNAWSFTGQWSLLITSNGNEPWGATSPSFPVEGGTLATGKLTLFTPAALSAVTVSMTFWSGASGNGTNLGTVAGDQGTFATTAGGTLTATITGANVPSGAHSATFVITEAALDASGTLLYIDTVMLAGGLVYSSSPVAGTDAVGNPISQGTNFRGLPGLTNVFGVEDPYGSQLAKIDAAGNISGQLLSASTDLLIAGNSVTDLLEDAPQGVVTAGWTPAGPWPSTPIGTTETALLELDQYLQAGRSYTLQVQPLDIQGSNGGNYRVYLNIRATSDGTTPNTTSTALVNNMPMNMAATSQGSCWMVHPGYTIVINPSATALYRFLVTGNTAGTGSGTFQLGASGLVMTITDNGVQTNNNTLNNGIALGSGTSGAGGGAQNWTENFYGTKGWTYGQSGLYNQQTSLFQGTPPGGSFAYHSWIQWAQGSLGNSLNTVLNYNVESVTLRLCNLFSYYSNGMTVSFHSGTTLGSLASVSSELQNWAIGEGQILTTQLTAAAWAPFKAGGITYTVLHSPNSSNDPQYYGYFYGPGNNAQQPLLTVKYSH